MPCVLAEALLPPANDETAVSTQVRVQRVAL